jgi:hypothetical protein
MWHESGTLQTCHPLKSPLKLFIIISDKTYLLAESDEMKKDYRGPYIDAFCQVWFHLEQLFQRSKLNTKINSFFWLANVKKIVSSEIAWPNGAKFGRKHLCKVQTWHRWSLGVRNKNCSWRPYLLAESDEMKKLYRGPYIDAFCQVLFHLAQLFQRSKLK